MPVQLRFKDRTEAGQLLADQLQSYASHPDALLLAIPRGGVPVAYEMSQRLGIPWDIWPARKLGMPGHPELAIGAISRGGVRFFNREVMGEHEVAPAELEQVMEREYQELQRREHLFCGDRPRVNPQDRTVIVVDDGIATGASLRAALASIRLEKPRRLVVAVPVAPPSTCRVLEAEVDDLITLIRPSPLYSVGAWYQNFQQVSDREVQAFLARSRAVQATRLQEG
ncbi:MAG: phosphoribosyltransferase [Synechococcaceae cyanobacterium SM2_3_1]|nr:phosphoribosyltransferase [Synechococcaceae cyanobacterium SM2_3_1]